VKTRIVKRPELGFWERIYLGTVVKGLLLTIKHFFGVCRDILNWKNKKTAITMQYPEERWDFKDNFRGAPALVKDQFGRDKCVACQICEFVCPPKAITIWPAEFADHGNNIEKFPDRFEIDMLRCIYCGMCEEACPCDAIELTEQFNIVGTSRVEKIYTKEKLLSN
jgi:NADH-quinone oxidoreductase subunit I